MQKISSEVQQVVEFQDKRERNPPGYGGLRTEPPFSCPAASGSCSAKTGDSRQA